MLGKGALSLLVDYGGDSSDDDVPGPRVSTKRTFKEEDKDNNFKKVCGNYTNCRLPVPDILLKNNKPCEEHVDDPLSHNGRIRSFAHERGNWATFIYIPLTQEDGVRDLIKEIVSSVPNLSINPVDDFHISLTRTVILKYHWITSFVDSVKFKINCINKFMVLFSQLKIYCNEERTRTFIGIQIKSGYDSLKKLVDILNTCLAEFKLQPFYEDPSFHLSIAWCVGDHEEELNQMLPQLNFKLQDVMESYSQENWCIYVNYIMCKTGNKCFKFELK